MYFKLCHIELKQLTKYTNSMIETEQQINDCIKKFLNIPTLCKNLIPNKGVFFLIYEETANSSLNCTDN